MTETLTSFTLRDVPWGKLGKIIDGEAIGSLEAARLGGLDFQVELRESAFQVNGDSKKPSWTPVPGRLAVVRRDTDQFFEFVSPDYTIVQYAEAFAFMDEIANAKYVAAGTFAEGRQAFMVVTLPERIRLNLVLNGVADPHSMYVILRTSHDKSRGLEVAVMMLRDACMNALTLSSLTRSAVQRWSVRHVGNDPMAKLDEARMTLAHADAYAVEFAGMAESLAAIDLEIAEAEKVLEKVLPAKPRRDRQIHQIITAWGDENTNGFAGNGWGLTNAVSEYFSWGRSDGLRTDRSRFTDGLTGPTHRYTDKTAQLLLRRR